MDHLLEIEERGVRFVVRNEDRVRVGRDPSCEVCVDHKLLGRQAIVIEGTLDGCLATPTGPSGTFVEGYRLPARAPLRAGMRLALAPDLHLCVHGPGKTLDERLPPASWPGLALSLFADLSALHERGLVLDLGAPDSVFVEDGGRGYLVPARVSAPQGMLSHNPLHFAPERMMTLRASPASDVFALASILYVQLFDRPAWDVESSPAATLVAKLRGPSAPPESKDAFARAIAPLLLSALAVEPTARPTAPRLRDAVGPMGLRLSLLSEITRLAQRYSGYRELWAGVEPGDRAWDDYEDAKELYRFFLRWQSAVEAIHESEVERYLAAAADALARSSQGGQGPILAAQLLERLRARYV